MIGLAVEEESLESAGTRDGSRDPVKKAVAAALVRTDGTLGMEMEKKDDRDAGRNRIL